MTEASSRPRGLDALMSPQSVAVIGASDDPTRIGGRPLRYLLDGGFEGAVHAVNPRRDRVQGLPSFASISAIEMPVDLAIVAVPAAAVLATLEECAAQGVGAAVVFSSGFAEAGDEGRPGQVAMRTIATDSGMRILGPNCLGLYNASIGLYATFSGTIELQRPSPGPVGVVSQSGAYGGHVAFLARRRGVHVGLLMTTGNECDVEAAECIEWMADRDEVAVIAACAEGLRNGDALCRALERARRRRKPVVFLKMGRSQAGAEAALSHTASLAGRDAVYDAVLAEFGAHRARDTDELLDVAYAASFRRLPVDRRVGLLSVSGGMGIQMADAAERDGLDVAPMPSATQARLKQKVPFASALNPVDMTAQVFNDPPLFWANLEAMLGEGGYGTVVVFFTYLAGLPAMVEVMREALTRARERFPDRLLVLCIIAPPEILSHYEAAGCPCFEDPDRAVHAVAALAAFSGAFDRAPRPVAFEAESAGLPTAVGNEADALQLLSRAGLSAAETRTVTSAQSAVEAAAALGYPVVLKVLSARVAHKTEVGGVRLDLEDAHAVRAAYEQILTSVRENAPGVSIDSVSVAHMAPAGVDLILGAQRDPLFGPVVIVGLGGIFVEIMDDTCLHRAPVDPATAQSMLRSLAAWPILAGARGRPRADVDAACHAIVLLSRFAATNAAVLESIDVNPLRVFPIGQGAVMLDALVQWRDRDDGPLYAESDAEAP